jgi:hypothetical protein
MGAADDGSTDVVGAIADIVEEDSDDTPCKAVESEKKQQMHSWMGEQSNVSIRHNRSQTCAASPIPSSLFSNRDNAPKDGLFRAVAFNTSSCAYSSVRLGSLINASCLTNAGAADVGRMTLSLPAEVRSRFKAVWGRLETADTAYGSLFVAVLVAMPSFDCFCIADFN